MSWERDPLWTKARRYFERAVAYRHDDELFGLWCSLGLELLARAALANISSTLLAEPDREHRNLLYALNRGAKRQPKKSIATAQVLNLCKTLIGGFSDEHFKASLALVNRRNDELHTGSAAFHEYPPNQWIGGLYRVCKVLSESMDESLESLLGKEEAESATAMLQEIANDLIQRVKSKIASHKNVFTEKDALEQEQAREKAAEDMKPLAYRGHHLVSCPSCGCTSSVQGETFGKSQLEIGDHEIIVRESISPRSFACTACGLRLTSYPELDAAGLGGHYTRTSTISPEDYYNLISVDDVAFSDYISDFLSSHPEFVDERIREMYMEEYDNE